MRLWSSIFRRALQARFKGGGFAALFVVDSTEADLLVFRGVKIRGSVSRGSVTPTYTPPIAYIGIIKDTATSPAGDCIVVQLAPSKKTQKQLIKDPKKESKNEPKKRAKKEPKKSQKRAKKWSKKEPKNETEYVQNREGFWVELHTPMATCKSTYTPPM